MVAYSATGKQKINLGCVFFTEKTETMSSNRNVQSLGSWVNLLNGGMDDILEIAMADCNYHLAEVRVHSFRQDHLPTCFHQHYSSHLAHLVQFHQTCRSVFQMAHHLKGVVHLRVHYHTLNKNKN